MSKKVYICEFNECERMFKAKYSLTRHIKSKHFKKKKYVCKHCNKKFALQHNLKEHEFIHTQALPYVCGIDGWTQSFRQRGKLCLHRWKHPGYNKRKYKKNSELNKDVDITQEGAMENDSGMNFHNNLNFAETMRQQNNFGFMGSMNSNYARVNSMMKMQKMENYHGMMNLDFIPPTIDASHRLNEMRQGNRFMGDNIMKMDSRNINRNFWYDSGDSDEESKGFGNKKEDDLFLNPYSSMIRRKENGLMQNGLGNEYDSGKMEPSPYTRFSEMPSQNIIVHQFRPKGMNNE